MGVLLAINLEMVKRAKPVSSPAKKMVKISFCSNQFIIVHCTEFVFVEDYCFYMWMWETSLELITGKQ